MATSPAADGVGIEDDEVGEPARPRGPVPEPVEPGLHVGQQVDRLLERKELVTAGPPCRGARWRS